MNVLRRMSRMLATMIHLLTSMARRRIFHSYLIIFNITVYFLYPCLRNKYVWSMVVLRLMSSTAIRSRNIELGSNN